MRDASPPAQTTVCTRFVRVGLDPGDLGQRRLVLLIIAITLMSLADLALTLTYMRSIGMIELNPVARYMVEIGQTQQLVLFKLFTTVLAGGTLFLLRRCRCAEPTAWLAVAIMLALMVRWNLYNEAVSSATDELTLLASGTQSCAGWIKLDS